MPATTEKAYDVQRKIADPAEGRDSRLCGGGARLFKYDSCPISYVWEDQELWFSRPWIFFGNWPSPL